MSAYYTLEMIFVQNFVAQSLRCVLYMSPYYTLEIILAWISWRKVYDAYYTWVRITQ